MQKKGAEGVRLSQRVLSIPSSNIRDSMKKTAAGTASGDLVNLAQGLPEFPTPDLFKLAAMKAIAGDRNQYCDTWGHPPVREAIAAKYLSHYGMKVSGADEITVTCGVSEALNCSVLSLVDPGDEVITFEPFYENYRPNTLIAHGIPRFVQLRKPNWTFDEKEMARAFNNKTKAIIINNPNNPTTRVFTREELEYIASLCQKWGTIAICDEIYEHMVYDGRRHIPMATIPGMEDLTFTCSGLGKAYNVTGWRVGWVIAPKRYTKAMRKLHDYMTLAAPTPLQIAGMDALASEQAFYDKVTADHEAMRDRLCAHLRNAGFDFLTPEGTYFVMADASRLGFKNDRALVKYMMDELKVIAVAGFGFYRPRRHTNMVRFCFAKRPSTLDTAGGRLLPLAARIGQPA